MRDDEPRPVRMSLPITHYVSFISSTLCTKLFVWGVCLLLQDLVQTNKAVCVGSVVN